MNRWALFCCCAVLWLLSPADLFSAQEKERGKREAGKTESAAQFIPAKNPALKFSLLDQRPRPARITFAATDTNYFKLNEWGQMYGRYRSWSERRIGRFSLKVGYIREPRYGVQFPRGFPGAGPSFVPTPTRSKGQMGIQIRW